MRQSLLTLAVIVDVGLAFPAYAPHSHFYDECKSVTIEGRVERVEFKNPHNLITLGLDDGTVYVADWINLTRMTSAGIINAAKEAVVPGARIVITGYRIRTASELRQVAPKFKGAVNPNTVEARSLRRMDDSFSWPLPPRASLPDCQRP